MTSTSSNALSGNSILVTGASGDIGAAVVRQCLLAGAFVFAATRDEQKLNTALGEDAENVFALIYDVTDEKAVKEAFRQVQKKQMEPKVGPLAGLVNAAGIMEEAPLSVSSMDKLKHQLNVNFLAPYQHIQLASRLMARQRKGSIVNIVSRVSESGASGMSAYASSKAALTGATKSLAKELAAIGIRVNGVAPGFIDTAMTEHYDGELRQAVIDKIKMKKAGSVDDVANAVLFLLSGNSVYTSGHILPVDGVFDPQ